MRKVLVVLIVIAGIFLIACTPTDLVTSVPTDMPTSVPTDMPTNIPTDMPAFLPTEISTQVPTLETTSDEILKNGTYFVDGQAIALVNGVAETELAPESASKQLTSFFGNRVDIDLNLDSLMDSAFLLQQENGGSGTFYYVVAALKTADGYLGTNAIFLGDRIAPQSTNIDPNNPSQFIVNYADRNVSEPMSSPPTVGVSRIFKLENGLLVEVVNPTTQIP